MRTLLYLIVSFLASVACAQNGNASLSALRKGLLIESSNTLIPWKCRLRDSAVIGTPKIYQTSEKNIEADWGRVTIFNGLAVSLKGYFRMVHGDWHLIHFYSFIDSSDLNEIKDHLDFYFRKNGSLGGRKKEAFFYQWNFSNHMLRLGRFPKGEKFEPYNDKYYIWIQWLWLAAANIGLPQCGLKNMASTIDHYSTLLLNLSWRIRDDPHCGKPWTLAAIVQHSHITWKDSYPFFLYFSLASVLAICLQKRKILSENII